MQYIDNREDQEVIDMVLNGYRNEILPNGTHLCIPKEVQDFVLAWTETILNPWVMPKKKQKEIA